MKTRIQIALLATFLAMAVHFYLTLHFYPLKFGFSSGTSICNLNSKFDCDAVAASTFSTVFGIPLAAWGLAFNAVLFMMILLSWLEWTEQPERLRRWTVLLAGSSVAVSVILAAISVIFLANYCPFCIAAYILSGVTFAALYGITREPFWTNLKRDPPYLFNESRGILISLILIPGLAFITHRSFSQNLGADQVNRLINNSVREWQEAPKQEFVAKPSLTYGPEKEAAKMTLVEFADFRCGHCKRASYTLHAFVRAHPDVRFEFYSFPLDGACNEKIEHSSGISCRLASAVVCGEREGKGWDVHDLLFAKQEEYMSMQMVSELDVVLSKQIGELGLNWESFQLCLNQPETLDAVKAQAKQGALVNVQGTPTVFANGKLLTRGQLVPVLQKVHSLSQ